MAIQPEKSSQNQSPVSKGNPSDGGKVTPEEAIRIQSGDLPVSGDSQELCKNCFRKSRFQW